MQGILSVIWSLEAHDPQSILDGLVVNSLAAWEGAPGPLFSGAMRRNESSRWGGQACVHEWRNMLTDRPCSMDWMPSGPQGLRCSADGSLLCLSVCDALACVEPLLSGRLL